MVNPRIFISPMFVFETSSFSRYHNQELPHVRQWCQLINIRGYVFQFEITMLKSSPLQEQEDGLP